MKRFSKQNILIGIFIIGILLRLGGIFEGLPAVYNSTEQALAKFTLKMAANQTLDPGFYIYPALYQYFLLAIYLVYYLFGLLLGIFQDSYDFAVQYLINPTGIYLIGRFTSIILSMISTWYMYRLVKRMLNDRAALLAATFMVLSFYIVVFSRYAIPESFMVFFTILALGKYWDSLYNQNAIHLFWAGIFTGLAIASKYNAGFLALGLCIAVYFSQNNIKDNIWKRTINAIGGLLLGFIIPNPYWLISPEKYLNGFFKIVKQSYYAVTSEKAISYVWEISQIITHELLLGFLFLGSILFALYKRKHYHIILLSVVLPTFIYVGSWDKKGIDYLLVCWPVFIILSAELVDFIGQKWHDKKIMNITGLSLILIPLFIFNLYHTILLILPDTRKVASEWLLTQWHSPEKIYYDKNGYDLQLIDIRRYTEYGVHAKTLNNEIKERLNAYTHLGRNVPFISSVEYVADLLDNSMNFQDEQAAIRWKSLDEIISEGATWVVSNTEFRRIYLEEQGEVVLSLKNRILVMEKFYSELNKRYQPIKVFKKQFWRCGPEIVIYKLQNK